MKSKILKITMIVILIMSLFQVGVHAELGEVTTTVETEKDTYKVGDKIEVTINWEKEVQALGMTITYDKDKLTFDSTTVGSNYYNADTEGEILYNWFSATDDKLTESTFTFIAKAEGKATISTDVQEYADEEMNPASGYINVPKEITIEKEEEQQPGGNDGEQNQGQTPGEDQNPGQTPGENQGQDSEKVTLESISITKEPTIYAYKAGAKFDTKGMEVTAKYSDGTTKVVKNYTYSPNGELKEGVEKIVISYTEDGVTKTAEQKITVIKNPEVGGTTNNNNKPTGDTTNKDNTKEDDTTAPGKIVDAGLETTGIMVIAIFAIIAFIGFKGYRRLSDI